MPDSSRSGRKDFGEAKSSWRALLPGDLVVVLAVAALAVALWGAPGVASTTVTGAVVVHDGTTLQSFTTADLQKVATYDFISEGYHFRIATDSGRIRFEAADCPDKVCVQTGWISRPPQVAACVPGHLLLRMLGDSGDVDVVTG